MVKHLLYILLVFSLSLSAPAFASAADFTETMARDAEKPQISIFFDGSTLRVTGAAGLNLYVYSITGVRVLSTRIEGADKSFNLNLQRGCYIVKVGNVVRKISIS